MRCRGLGARFAEHVPNAEEEEGITARVLHPSSNPGIAIQFTGDTVDRGPPPSDYLQDDKMTPEC